VSDNTTKQSRNLASPTTNKYNFDRKHHKTDVYLCYRRSVPTYVKTQKQNAVLIIQYQRTPFLNYVTFTTLQNEFYPSVCAAQHVSKEKCEVLIFAKNVSKRKCGSCGLISCSALNHGKLADCRLFGATLQSNQTKAEDRFEISFQFTLGYKASRHSNAHAV
jgi:hypothetical protein